MPDEAAANNQTSNDSAAIDTREHSSGSSGASDNVTTRNWDGWPTEPTPHYLVPRMGKVPVSSTTHFQTVALTGIGEGGYSETLWRKLRVPLLAAMRERPENIEGRLVVTKAEYGDFREPVTVDVTSRVRGMVEDGVVERDVDSRIFGDPAPGELQALRVNYIVEGVPDSHAEAIVRAGEKLSIPRNLIITSAVYGAFPEGPVEDVLDTLLPAVTANRLSGTVNDAELGVALDTRQKKQLVVNYTLDGLDGRVVVDEGGTIQLPVGLNILHAEFGRLAGLTQDVTAEVAGRIEGLRLKVKASVDNLKVDPAPDRPKELRIEYTIDGVPGQAVARDNELIEIEAPPRTYEPEAIHKTYFQREISSITELADRLVDGGFKATDFDSADEFATMRDVLETMMGGARHDRLDPLQHGQADAMDMPAEGVILYHEQGWYGRGLALGNLLHSVALAPGEVTQVAMTHWNHETRATDSETVSQEDTQSQASTQNRAVAEIQSSALHEHAAGDSSASSSSLSTSAGTSKTGASAKWTPFRGVSGEITGSSSSVGTSQTVSTAVTHSSGDRSLSMGSNQSINALTKQHAEAARTRRATVVREVTQSEDETLTTRVVANYNHMHALTVMYYEVIEVYSLKTRVVDAERVIFLPYELRDVRELVPRYRAILIDAANAIDQFELAQAIHHYDKDLGTIPLLKLELKTDESTIQPASDDDNAGQQYPIYQRILATLKEIQLVRNELNDLADTFKQHPSSYETQIEDVRDELETARGKRETVIKTFAGFRDMPEMFGDVVRQALQSQLKPIDEEVARKQAAMRSLTAAIYQRDRALIRRRDRAQRTLAQLEREKLHLETAVSLLNNLAGAEESGPFHDNRLYFNQAVWLSLSAGEVLGMAQRMGEFRGEPLYNSIDPQPVAITGNYVGYRWRIRDPMVKDRFKKRFVEPYIGDPERELATVEADIAVPTGGVFGEAVLGDAVSAEKIDLSRFWNWKDSMIPILPTSINPLSAVTPQAQDLSAEPGKLDESSAKFTPLQDLPTPSGFGALAQTMQAQVFRDMTGQSMLQSLAEATTQAASSSEQHAAEIASKNLKAGLDFMSDMGAKALSVAAAPETGGGSLLGSLAASKQGGGASLLGGVLNAEGATGGDLLGKLSGNKGSWTAEVEDSVIGGLTGETGESSGGKGANSNDVVVTDEGASADGDDEQDAGDNLPPSEVEPNPPVPGDN